MMIRELHLHGFGKFNDYSLKLEPGLNIIYGPNESGKSTLHSFINGMFYGFRKPYTKRTLYSKDHNRFSPWSGSNYSGSIVFEKDNKLYRIYRVFDKGKEETRVLCEETGEDITDRIHSGDNSKVLQPGEYFFGISSGVFNSTMFIGQQDIAFGKSLAHEVRERLVNVSSTGNENISVEKAIFLLDEELKDIGTSRASTSEYGRLLTEIQETEKKLGNVEAEVVKYDDYVTKRKALLDELSLVEIEIKNNQAAIKEMENLERISKYREILELRHKNNSLGEELERLAVHETKSQEDYNEVVKLSEEIGIANSRIGSLEEQMEVIEERYTRLYGSRDEDDINSLDIIEDGYRFQKLDYQTTEDRDLVSLENDKIKLLQGQRVLRWVLIVISILYISSNILAYARGNYLIFVTAQIVLIPLLY
ncbi:MAG: AAA family ATPase, partial [Gudongella sp.]|nr:AAA family ATPase [Gudongella sp.]